MSPDQIAEVWGMLDRGFLANVVHRGPPPIFATISGAHLYGFASPDSDVDLRGAFLLPAERLFGFLPAAETVTLTDRERYDLDWAAHDLRKFARMMVNHNGYAMEQLFSPLVVVDSPAFAELKDLARNCLTRPTVNHYQGFVRGRRRRLSEPEPTVKHLLYAYRVLFSGIHLMRAGEIEANLPALNKIFRMEIVDELIQRKREGSERMLLSSGELAEHGMILDRLERDLAAAHSASRLPDEPAAGPLERFVIDLRLRTIRDDGHRP